MAYESAAAPASTLEHEPPTRRAAIRSTPCHMTAAVESPSQRKKRAKAPTETEQPLDPRHVDVEQQLERLHEQSFGWALACCGHHEADAEDVLQVTYARVISGQAVFKGRSSFRTWLFGVIRMVALEQTRRRKRRSRLDSEVAGRLELVSEPEAPGRIERSEVTRRLLEALATLPDRQREVLHLVFYEGLTVGEAAGVLGIGVGSARTHYARGKNRMRLLLGETDG